MSTPQLNSNGNNVGSLDKILQVVLSVPSFIDLLSNTAFIQEIEQRQSCHLLPCSLQDIAMCPLLLWTVVKFYIFCYEMTSFSKPSKSWEINNTTCLKP